MIQNRGDAFQKSLLNGFKYEEKVFLGYFSYKLLIK
tara:strand:+ start:1038 stop:1145 length:108 start_codon:yes stop_codon:yes gene_type:complete